MPTDKPYVVETMRADGSVGLRSWHATVPEALHAAAVLARVGHNVAAGVAVIERSDAIDGRRPEERSEARAGSPLLTEGETPCELRCKGFAYLCGWPRACPCVKRLEQDSLFPMRAHRFF